ncbi:MAG: choice-of-anchor D domain-containing protein, partial [Reichenbachiella sp.]
DDNYDFSYTDGTLTVNKATLTATAANQSRLYGESNPTFTIDYTGFVNGEDATVIVTEPTATTTATAASDPGGYSIVLTGGLDDNYDFNLLNGTLTITVLNPSITSFTPSQALAGATITVTGTNFTGATSVQFGGTESASFVVDNDTQITAIVGSGSTGSISVTTPGGTGASVLSLTVDNVAPTVTSLTLNSIYTGTESSIEYLVTFDEDVINLDYTDFDLSTAGTATGTLNTTITGSGDTYLMSIDNISGTGSITLNAIVDDITDVAGNPLMAGLTGSVHNVDRDQPMITLLDMTNGSTNISNGSTVNFGSAIMGNDINRTFSVSNTGTADLNVTQVSLGTGTSYTNSSVTVPVVITPDSDFTFTTTLSEGVSGTFEDVITITSNDSIQPLYSFNLTGSIIEEVPIFSLFEGADNQGNPIDNDAVFSVDFGEVNLSDSIISKSFYIQNSGTGVLIVSQITSSDELLQIEADLPLSLAENEGESFKIIISENETGEINAILEIITNQFTTSIAVTADIVAAQEIEEESPPISVFNVVTPNGDGIHDYLKIVNIEEYQDNKVFIFS